MSRSELVLTTRSIEKPNALYFPAPNAADAVGLRILLAGSGRPVEQLYRNVKKAEQSATVVGLAECGSNPLKGLGSHSVPVLGSWCDLQDLILEHCIDQVHVALDATNSVEQMVSLKTMTAELGVPITFHFNGMEKGITGEPDVWAKSPLASYNRHPSANRWASLFKRAVDVTIASTALIALSPLFVLIAMAIKATSDGPVFFRQWRVGKGRRQFGMLKFRTMVKNAEELRHQVQSLNDAKGISFKLFRDPRVTKVGRLLRLSSLDELPQLVNVVMGEMSLVGPRPIPTWVAEQLNCTTYLRRFCVMPGLTGLWQVEGREQDFDRMATQDLRYVDHWSPTLDLKILVKTLPAVLRGEGAH